MKRILPLLAILALPAARADLVAQYTFARGNPLEAKVGADAKESSGQISYSDTAANIAAVTDEAVLGDRTGVVSVPKGSGLSIKVPDSFDVKNWCMVLHFYAPTSDSSHWRTFWSVSQNNTGDGAIFMRGTEIGQQSYTSLGSAAKDVWHQLVASTANGITTVWYDTQKLGSWSGKSPPSGGWIHVSLDDNEEDGTLYFDEVRLYSESKPAEIFPDGANAAVVETDRDQSSGAAILFF